MFWIIFRFHIHEEEIWREIRTKLFYVKLYFSNSLFFKFVCFTKKKLFEIFLKIVINKKNIIFITFWKHTMIQIKYFSNKQFFFLTKPAIILKKEII